MWSITFEPHSLLFGESCLWLYLWISIPYQLWPDFNQTKSYHLFKHSKWALFILKVILWMKSTWIIEKVGLFMTYSVQPIYYSLIVFELAPLAQDSFLLYLNKVNREELAYKVLYSIPITTKFINLIQLIVALVYTSRSHYKEWYTYDGCREFAITPMDQFKNMVLTVLAVLPDYMRSWLDTLFMISFLRSGRYKMFQSILNSTSTTALFLAFNMIAATTCFVFRYKPIANIIYAQICLRQHLKHLREELLMSYDKSESKLTVMPITSSNPDDLVESVASASSMSSQIRDVLPFTNKTNHDRQTATSNGQSSYGFRGSSLFGKLVKERSASSRRASLRAKRKLESKAGANGTHSGRQVVAIVDTREMSSGDQEGSELQTISSLFSLEKHLTQLYLFVTAMDRQSPLLVFSTIVMNIMLVFHSGLYLREVPTQQVHWHFMFFFCVGPFMPLVVLFMCGNLIELECRRITNLMERIYFQDPSQMLLYKHMKDSQHSLLNIFRLLERTRFSCDQLIKINFETFKSVAFYIMSGLFIVIQYDLLSLSRANAEESPELEATTTTPDPNGRSLFWNNNGSFNKTYQPKLFD